MPPHSAHPAALAAAFTHPAHSGLRSLFAGAALALTVAALAAAPAHAKPREPRIDDLCAIPGRAVGASEDWVFYEGGETIEVDGDTYYCGDYGRWHLLY